MKMMMKINNLSSKKFSKYDKKNIVHVNVRNYIIYIYKV